jgi:hypothetical protein
VASVIGAGTYSWFVQYNENSIITGQATLKAANIKIENMTLDLQQQDIYLYSNIGANLDADGKWIPSRVLQNGDIVTLDPIVPSGTPTTAADKIVYPSEGVRFTFANTNTTFGFNFNHSDGIVVEINFAEMVTGMNAIQTAFRAIAAPNAGGASVEDIYAKFNVDNDKLNALGTGIFNVGNKFYFHLTNPNEFSLDDLNAILNAYSFDVGIIGVNANQNHYMNTPLLVRGSDIQSSITITAVQATEQAVLDVFGLNFDLTNGTLEIPATDGGTGGDGDGGAGDDDTLCILCEKEPKFPGYGDFCEDCLPF